MEVAVIILNYNSFDDCQKCVSFLKRQEGVKLEIILVDNCSSDGDRVEALCREQNCTFIASSENRGYNAGNNIGLRYAAEKGYLYALIVNPDMEFPQLNYVKELVAAMEMDRDIVAVGSDIVGVDGSHQSPMKRQNSWIYSFGWIKDLLRSKSSETQNIGNYQVSHYCWKICGSCLMVRMAFIKDIGFFDEYPFLYCEESIFAEQVYKAEKKIFYLATSQAIHCHISALKGDSVKRLKQWKRSRLYFIDRYSGDTWVCKKIASLSITIYVNLFSIVKKIKEWNVKGILI